MESLVVHTNTDFWAEKRHILTGFLTDRAHVAWRMEETNSPFITISKPPSPHKIVLSSAIFECLKRRDLFSRLRPVEKIYLDQKIVTWTYDEHWQKSEIESPHSSFIDFDLLGMSFLLLSRYEEYISPIKDELGRFPDKENLLVKHHLFHRPLVDEYYNFFTQLMRTVWPELRTDMPRYRPFITHDIDWPFVVFGRSMRHVLKNIGADLIVRKSPRTALNRLISLSMRSRGEAEDPANTFRFLMDLSERNNTRSAFFFLPLQTDQTKDSRFPGDSSAFREIVESIARRGHEIGIHPGFRTCDNPELLGRSVQTLRDYCKKLEISPSLVEGGRQHYLRWKNPLTWRLWSENQLGYDSSLGFSTMPGFRCGTSVPYQVFDLEQKTPLPLIERPLVCMDVTLTFENKRSAPDEFNRVSDLIEKCRRFGGEFVLLWHNSNFLTPQAKDFYTELVRAAS